MNRTRKAQKGFTTIQLVITITIASIVCAFAFVGISSARGHIRRASSARQFAALAERARSDSIRRHAPSSLQSGIEQIDETTYAVTMDFSGNGTVTTQNFTTESGVSLSMPREITFDWRGRIFAETQVTFSNTILGSLNYSLVNISGSGDVTLDAEIFYDGSVPTPALNGTGGSVIADPTPSPGGSSPTPTATPTPDPNATPTPTPDPNATPTPQPTATPLPSPTPTATPTPSPTPNPTPTPTPTPVPCTITASPTSLSIARNKSGTVSISLVNFVGTGTITATSSNSGQIQVTPASATVSGSTAKTFTVTVKRTAGSVRFSSACGSPRTVTVAVQ